MISILLCTLAHATDLPEWSFDDGEAGFVAESGLQWQWGRNSAGQWGWSTRLDGLYLNDATDRLVVPMVDLMDTARPLLRLQHEYDIDQTGDGDAGWLEGFVDEEWVRIEPVYDYPTIHGFTGTSDGMMWDWFDLSGLGPTAHLRLVFASDGAVRRNGWFIQNLKIEDGDPIPPLIQSVSELPDTTDVFGPYTLSASIIDDTSVAWADVHWTTNNGPSASSPMTATEGTLFTGFISGHDPGTIVSWWIEASDGRNFTRWPASGAAEFSVRLPPPSNLQPTTELPNGRLADTQIGIRWLPPDTDHEIIGYAIERDGMRIASPNAPETTIQLVDGMQSIVARTVFNIDGEQFTGDPSEPLELDVALPILHSIQPNNAWPGDFLRVTIAGENLYLDASDCTLLTGPGINLENFEVVDAHTARGLIHVAADTPSGSRAFTLQNGSTAIESDVEFLIQSAGDRPIVLGAHPTSVRQGARTTVFLDMSSPANLSKPPPIVDLGEGIIVEEVVRRATGIDVQLSVAHDAPLGDHNIEVDEGDRLITGASLEVRDTPKIPDRNCASISQRSVSFVWLWTVMVLAITRRPKHN